MQIETVKSETEPSENMKAETESSENVKFEAEPSENVKSEAEPSENLVWSRTIRKFSLKLINQKIWSKDEP